MPKLTSAQYNVIDAALGYTGYISLYEDGRVIQALLRNGYIIREDDSVSTTQGFNLKLTYNGIIAVMRFITNDLNGAIDCEMIRFTTKLNKFEMYATRYK